jgi:hypothetical protein
MRQYLAMAAALTLAAGAAHAQFFQHPSPYRPPEPVDPAAAAKLWALPEPPKPTGPRPMPTWNPGPKQHVPGEFQPYQPPRAVNVYDDGPFSPAAEAKRARNANAAPPGGMFSPEAEAKRERERAKAFHPY